MSQLHKGTVTSLALGVVILMLFSGAPGPGHGSAASDLASIQGRKPGPEQCSSGRFPTNVSNPVQCCQDGNRTWHTNDGRVLAYRTYGRPCREANGVGTNCGVGSTPFVPCAFGPCGGMTVWAVLADEVRVFFPISKPKKCGWEVRNIQTCLISEDPDGCVGPPGSTRSKPEPYVDQLLYPGLISTCPFTRCLKGGTPVL